MEDERLFVLSHIGSSFEKGGLYVDLSRKGDNYTLTIDGKPTEIHLRLPENTKLSGPQSGMIKDGYFIIKHTGGKQVYLYDLIPQIRILRAHPNVSDAAGKLCVQRGLTTYCVEGIDNPVPLSALRLSEDAVFSEEKVDWLDEDMPVLKTTGHVVSVENWENSLYRSQKSVYESRVITLIPYCQWGNRGENEMRVWLTEK